MAESPDCGHIYTSPSAGQPGDRYALEATTTWSVPWEGGGESGTITTTRTSNSTVAIGELHVVN
ncbi:hypothetical protein [Streptomyces xiamenensis]|uniref:hypothetical protein n=1 Tax=Streptomyces xiamenensis TaxID=408015 RepID=UPI0035D56691